VSAMLPKILGAKVILDQHDPMPELMTTIFGFDKNSLAVGAIKYLEKWSMARAHMVITVNVACKRIFANRSCRPEKIGIVMNAPDEQIFKAQPPRPRPPLDITSRKQFVVMYHGSIVERNGLDLAVDAFARLRQTLPFAELRIFGRKTDFLEKVMEDARTRGVEGLRYMGPRSLEALVPEIEACDLGIIPNHHSAFAEINTPTRIFEYLSLGKPVIAPRTTGICDYFADDALIFFEPGDAADLTLQMERVASDCAAAMRTAAVGQQVYLSHTWKSERQRLLELIRNLFDERPCL
jgi:glycosyltransferase involved in cell wall biosynthesis